MDTRNRQSPSSRKRSRSRGATTIQILVILVPVLFGLIGFAVDLGRLYMVRAELKTAAASMALASASHLIGTDQGLVDAQTASQIPIDSSTGYGNRYDFGGLVIGQTNGQLSSNAPGPTFFGTLQDALSGSNAGAGNSSSRYAGVTVTADAPLVFWRFLPLAAEGKVSVQAAAVAGISAPLCTVCSIQPIAVAAADQTDTVDFGFIQGTIYTLGYSCTGVPAPAGLPTTAGATALVPYLLLDRYNTADTVFPDESAQLLRAGANGMPGSNPTLGLLSNSSSQPISCFTINNSTLESVWASATPVACRATVAAAVQSQLCGMDLRFEPSPSATFSATCSGIASVSTLEPAFYQDTDVAEEDAYASYSGNGRRLITISIVDTLNPAGMTVLGFRQFLLQPTLNTTTLNPADTDGRFLAMYVGNVAPVPQGTFGSCGVTAGPGKVVLHQ